MDDSGKMTLEQIRDALIEEHEGAVDNRFMIMADAIDAHVAHVAPRDVRVTDEDVTKAVHAATVYGNNHYFGGSAYRECMRAALESFAASLPMAKVPDDSRLAIYQGIAMRICAILQEYGIEDLEDPADALEIFLAKNRLWEVKENPWYAAITDACVINFLEWHDQDARKTLQELICLENKIALDPSVSSAARHLIVQGCIDSFNGWKSKRLAEGYTIVSPSGDGVFINDSDDRIADELLRQVATSILTQGHVGVRDGWKLVPVEPTERMLHVGMPWFAAWQHRRKGDKESTLAEAYKNMLAAAPAYDDGGNGNG